MCFGLLSRSFGGWLVLLLNKVTCLVLVIRFIGHGVAPINDCNPLCIAWNGLTLLIIILPRLFLYQLLESKWRSNELGVYIASFVSR